MRCEVPVHVKFSTCAWERMDQARAYKVNTNQCCSCGVAYSTTVSLDHSSSQRRASTAPFTSTCCRISRCHKSRKSDHFATGWRAAPLEPARETLPHRNHSWKMDWMWWTHSFTPSFFWHYPFRFLLLGLCQGSGLCYKSAKFRGTEAENDHRYRYHYMGKCLKPLGKKLVFVLTCKRLTVLKLNFIEHFWKLMLL